MWTLPALFVTLAAWSFGLALVGLAERIGSESRTDPRSGAERFGLGLLCGLSALAALEVAATVAFGPLPHTAVRVALGLALLSGLPFLRASFKRGVGLPPNEPPPTLWHRLGLVAIALFAAFAVFYAASSPMHLWDPIFHFAYKGKLIEHEGFRTASWLVDPLLGSGPSGIGRVITHPNYPPGLGAWHALVAQAGGVFEIDATRAIFSAFAIAPAALLWARLRPRGRGPATLAALLWLAVPLLYYSRLPRSMWTFDGTIEEGFASLHFGEDVFPAILSGQWVPFFTDPELDVPDGWTLDGAADLPLAALIFAALTQLLRFIPGQGRRGDASDLLLGGLLFGGAILTKNEGLLLWAGAAAVLLPAARLLGAEVGRARGANWRGVAWLAGGLGLGLLVAGPWLAIRGEIPSIDEDYPRAILIVLGLEEPPENMPSGSLQPVTLGGAARRAPFVATLMLVSFTHVFRWNTLWLVFFGGVFGVLLRRPRHALRHPATPEALFVIACAFGYGLTLVVTSWNLLLLFGTVIPGRLLLHLAPVAIAAGMACMYTRRDGIEAPAVEEPPADPAGNLERAGG